jgi:uncharacterized protein (TIGR04255 family)
MSKQGFKNPPLVEAIVEVKWELKESTPIGKRDPHYQFLLGVFHDKIQSEYPFHEELPASKVPDEVTGSIVKHRFRTGEKDWPVVQIGPGIMVVNETKKYDTFDSFKPRATAAMGFLFDSYPKREELNITSLLLRYINAHEFDYSKRKVQEFISNEMHVPSEIPSFFLAGGKIEELPVSYSLKTSLRCNEPPGIVSFWVDTGHKLKQRVVIWNHIFESTEADLPDMPEGFGEWLQQAHDVIHIWFDGVIQGYLEQEFNK